MVFVRILLSWQSVLRLPNYFNFKQTKDFPIPSIQINPILFLRSLNCLQKIRLGILALYFCSLYSKSHFSLSIPSASTTKVIATISKSENLETRLQRGMFLYSFTRLFENCLYIQKILINFVICCAYDNLELIALKLLIY